MAPLAIRRTVRRAGPDPRTRRRLLRLLTALPPVGATDRADAGHPRRVELGCDLPPVRSSDLRVPREALDVARGAQAPRTPWRRLLRPAGLGRVVSAGRTPD